MKPITAVWPGKPAPRGAHWDGAGVNFALFSGHAERVELCIFDAGGRRELQRIAPIERTDQIWHCYLPEARPGMLYGYRVHGPYRPDDGHRFNPHKLMLDPYARQIVGALRWSDALFGYTVGHRRGDLSLDRRDSAGAMPKSRIVDPAFTWGDDTPPAVPWEAMVVYEMHVRGFTMQHPDVPPPLRGTYAGLATPAIIDYLKRLGVTSLELLPVHAFVDDRHLTEKGLRNYWGYNSIGFFAPDARYSASGSISEFKTMVKTLHSAGIEVILDVVYNHTAEGNELGPMLCFKGVDNHAYYRLQKDRKRYYTDYTGCGNTLDTRHPAVLQMIMDSLRYWVTEMHVDGFRFDLASTLAREAHEVDPFGSFFDIVHQDPVLRGVKLIAEPWDLGEGGYQVGNFPPGWAEWNDKYRDTMRRYWRGDGGLIGEFARRLTGSSDLYGRNGRLPRASVNFITAHDGFTLRDLVSYNEKHNEANLEDNRDGTDDNRSWNCGAEGPTDDPAIVAMRARQMRNFLTTLFLSQGVPMLLGGDEFGRTQHGNNNAWCQDNELSWFDWNWNDEQRALYEFTKRVIKLRREHPVFHRSKFFEGQGSPGSDLPDVWWMRPDGRRMTRRDWARGDAYSIGVFLNGDEIRTRSAAGELVRDDSFLLLFNGHYEPVSFKLPTRRFGVRWELVLATDDDARGGEQFGARAEVPVDSRSLTVLKRL